MMSPYAVDSHASGRPGSRFSVGQFGLFGIVLLAGILLPLVVRAGSSANQQAASSAAAYLQLSTVQNADGSWGATEDIRSLYTAAVVDALRADNERSPAYFRGVAWLENRAMKNVDDHARRVVALFANGDDVSADRAFLKTNVSHQLQSASGWGLSDVYAPSVRDTALALLAFGELGVAPDVSADVQAGLDFLKATQAPDGSWAVSAGAAGDPIVTALVLQALTAHLAFDPTVLANGNAAASYLQVSVGGNAGALELAHAVRGRLGWFGAGAAAVQINAMVALQSVNGSWGNDPYTTALALDALAVDLGRDEPAFQQVLAIGDFDLRSAVNLELSRNRGDTLRSGDLQDLTSLSGPGTGISDLTGLEQATNLGFVDLRNTNVSDVSPISGLIGSATILLQNTPWAGTMCDVSQDGLIGVADAVLANRLASGTYTPTLLEQTRADIAPASGPGDGVVDVGDAVRMLRRVSGVPNNVCP